MLNEQITHWQWDTYAGVNYQEKREVVSAREWQPKLDFTGRYDCPQAILLHFHHCEKIRSIT